MCFTSRSARHVYFDVVDTALYHEFAMATAGIDTHVDLFGGAMVIAKLGSRCVDPHAVARELDLIAEAVHERVAERAGTEALIQAINTELFEVCGFRGNTENYSDPENSFLDRVIERRTGIPITLSLVYMEIAQRVGLRCDGVGYPGHFLVRCGDPDDSVYLDPFAQGARRPVDDLVGALRGRHTGGPTPESFLAAVTRRQILQRMLANLHTIFRNQRDLHSWLDVVELQLRMEPWNVALVGERGMLHYRLGERSQALDDLERYVNAAPDPAPTGAQRLLDQLRLDLRGSKELQ